MTRLQHFLKAEDGTSTIEFCFVVPLVLTIFFASFESSYYMVRHVMLERSVDQVVRDLRLGTLIPTGTTPTAGHALLKDAICKRSALISSLNGCLDSIRIWLQPLNASFDINPPDACVDKTAGVAPLTTIPAGEFAPGNANDIMLMRVCLREEPMFSTTAVGAAMIRSDGEFALVSTSVFVNEPG
ncbi:TadE/TadG family type IV pilus assembly protein [Tabrizicola sp. BL-A-41-H6]|uniref:TadE/TadG family type IV pilus assembly protein n=1 Tax=Tabrizicola sp. BL-A-41-H6 TaxID=3421107 RepID=UPI003D6710E5